MDSRHHQRRAYCRCESGRDIPVFYHEWIRRDRQQHQQDLAFRDWSRLESHTNHTAIGRKSSATAFFRE
jgi:hypothetical protein